MSSDFKNPKVISQAEVDAMENEPDSYLVCCTVEQDPGVFEDNLIGQCSGCGDDIVFRPHFADVKMKKICKRCMDIGAAKELAKGGEVEHLISQNVRDEVDAVLAKHGIKKPQ